jgi:hypothetical protein
MKTTKMSAKEVVAWIVGEIGMHGHNPGGRITVADVDAACGTGAFGRAAKLTRSDRWQGRRGPGKVSIHSYVIGPCTAEEAARSGNLVEGMPMSRAGAGAATDLVAVKYPGVG